MSQALRELDEITLELRQRAVLVVTKDVVRDEVGRIASVTELHVRPDVQALVDKGAAAAQEALAGPVDERPLAGGCHAHTGLTTLNPGLCCPRSQG